MLYLVRHAEVTVDPAREPPEWRLTAAGRAAAARLASAPCWSGVSAVAASAEPKALDTAAPIATAAGVAVQVERELGEVRRNASWADGADVYIGLVSRYLSGEELPGWEPAQAVQARVRRAVDRVLAGRDSACVVSHGLALSLYLGLTPAEWEAIALPAVALVDPADGKLVRPFAAVEQFLAGAEQ